MKRLFALMLIFSSSFVYAAGDDSIPEPTQNPQAIFRLFRTRNIYALLKLDTRTGQVWQVQWGDGDHRFIAPINRTILVLPGPKDPPVTLRAGRFTLYPTANIYTFVLLDQEEGRTWQIQWGDEKDRYIVPLP